MCKLEIEVLVQLVGRRLMVASVAKLVVVVLWRPPEDRRAAGVFTDGSCSPGAMLVVDAEVKLQQSAEHFHQALPYRAGPTPGCDPADQDALDGRGSPGSLKRVAFPLEALGKRRLMLQGLSCPRNQRQLCSFLWRTSVLFFTSPVIGFGSVQAALMGSCYLGSGLQNALCMVICALFRGNGRFTAFSPQPTQPQDLGSGQVSLFSLFPASRPWSNSSYLQN